MVVLAYTDFAADSLIVMALLFIAGDGNAQNDDRTDAFVLKASGDSNMDDRFWDFIASHGGSHCTNGADPIYTLADVGSDVDGDFLRSGHRLGTQSSLGSAF